jgi:hypothetical protein
VLEKKVAIIRTGIIAEFIKNAVGTVIDKFNYKRQLHLNKLIELFQIGIWIKN